MILITSTIFYNTKTNSKFHMNNDNIWTQKLKILFFKNLNLIKNCFFFLYLKLNSIRNDEELSKSSPLFVCLKLILGKTKIFLEFNTWCEIVDDVRCFWWSNNWRNHSQLFSCKMSWFSRDWETSRLTSI